MIEQRHVVAPDGTRIGYQFAGPENARAPVVVLANGLGGTHVAFKHLYDVLGDYRVLCWDYRGLYTSDAPSDPRANTMPHHVGDLIAVLDAEHVGEVVLVGWSMGVQLAFEAIRMHRERIRGLLAINGTYGRAFQTVMGSRLVGQIIPMLLRLVRAQASLVGRATKALAGSDALIAAMKRVGLVSGTIDVEIFRQVAGGFQDIDWVIYSDLLARLDEHDAEAVLATIDIPVTIVTGDRDVMTPPSTAALLNAAIPGSRMVVIKGGTHYTPVEYPAILADELGMLLDRVPGWERARRSAGSKDAS